MEIAEMKSRLDLRVLVQETHEIERSGKVHCPFHEDAHPSCHIYRDGFKCFACGVYGDHLDWLQRVHGLGMKEAIAELRRRSEGVPPPLRKARRRRVHDSRPVPVSASLAGRYRRWLQRSGRLPAALDGRGLDPAAARRLGLAALGEDAVIPIRDPAGRLVALKRRFGRRSGGQRYDYLSAGHGSPAWCSPAIAESQTVLVVEGELNAMVTYLALEEAGARVGVMGAAGSSGRLDDRALVGRDVYLMADDDEAGRAALGRWRRQAVQAGARSVTPLPPHEHDACELAAAFGRRRLGQLTLGRMFGGEREEEADGRIPSGHDLPQLSR